MKWKKWFSRGLKGEKRADFLVARVFQHWARGLAVSVPYPENKMAIVLSTPKLSQTSRAGGLCEKTKPTPVVLPITVKSTDLQNCCCRGGHLTRRREEEEHMGKLR